MKLIHGAHHHFNGHIDDIWSTMCLSLVKMGSISSKIALFLEFMFRLFARILLNADWVLGLRVWLDHLLPSTAVCNSGTPHSDNLSSMNPHASHDVRRRFENGNDNPSTSNGEAGSVLMVGAEIYHFWHGPIGRWSSCLKVTKSALVGDAYRNLHGQLPKIATSVVVRKLLPHVIS